MGRIIKDVKNKALDINLNEQIYGTFAEIGAGQEVARWFFQAGGASRTVAKTMSAYDMVFSDAIYGKEESGRYVCEARLLKMLTKEFNLLLVRLEEKRATNTLFFTFANTVATSGFIKKQDGHGWMGIRFQHEPKSPPSDLIIHVSLKDESNSAQQDAIGIMGVNLIHTAFFLRNRQETTEEEFVKSLMDHLSFDRIEVDCIKVLGPAFAGVDNRVLSLYLVKNKMTNMVIFNSEGEVIRPADLLYKKNILTLRGSFRPPTLVNMDMMESATRQFFEDKDVKEEETIILTELTLNNLRLKDEGQAKPDLDQDDFKDYLARVDLLHALGKNVVVSNYHEYYKLVGHFNKFAVKKLALVLGVHNLKDVFTPDYYQELPGGILQAMGMLFKKNVRFYVYPATQEENGDLNKLVRCKDIKLHDDLQGLYLYFLDKDFFIDLKHFTRDYLSIYSRKVLKLISGNQLEWEKMVPKVVAKMIHAKCLFGLPCSIEKIQRLEELEKKKLIEETGEKRAVVQEE